MKSGIKVKINGEDVETVKSTMIMELLKSHPHPGDLPPLGAVVNRRLTGLHYQLVSDCEVRTVDYNSKEGASIYRRTASLILYEAVSELFPGSSIEIGQHLSGGYFFLLNMKDVPLTEETVSMIQEKMEKIVREDRVIHPERIYTEEAIEYFKIKGFPDKVQLLETRREAEVLWVSIGKFRDLFLSPLGPSTGVITNFSLDFYSPGFDFQPITPQEKYQTTPS